MQQIPVEIWMWIIGGIIAAFSAILTAIWARLGKTEDKVDRILEIAVVNGTKIDKTEETLDKLPCLNNLICPAGVKQ